jgi:dipeptidase
MIALLERHGQGGDCGHLGRFYYHNSFIIADTREAFVLETVGRWWAVERVAETRALSNALSIGDAPWRISHALAEHATSEGWLDREGRFDFASRLIDEARDAVSFGRGRCARGAALLEARSGALSPIAMMDILRDHGAEAAGKADWSPDQTVGRTICMHAGPGARRSQTTASMVAELRDGRAVVWVTAGAAPCLSVFRPVVVGAATPDLGPWPGDRFDAASRWWRHERWHRAALRDYTAASALIAAERPKLEAAFLSRVDQAVRVGGAVVDSAIAECWREADAAERRWRQMLPRRAATGAGSYARSWARLNHVACFPASPAAPPRPRSTGACRCDATGSISDG